jgi:transposase
MSKQALEVRRRTAVKLVVDGGFSHRQAAASVGAVPSSVSGWVNAFRRGGEEALCAKPEPTERQRRLSDEQRGRLAEIIVNGAVSQGFNSELWTLSRIKVVVQREFGESFHIGHLHRIVRDLGFSSQKPERRAREQDPAAVKAFREDTWPKLGKERRRRAVPSS